MKRLLLVLLVTAVILTVGCAKTTTPEPETPTQIIADITTDQASTLIEENQNNPDFVILDVRTPAEFDSGHIENAMNIDKNSETFQDKLEKLEKDKTYLIYCAVGGRSADARDMMQGLGFMEVYNMLEGINQWQADRLPITEPTTE
jgi:rhodanese-related sulfurtransferase